MRTSPAGNLIHQIDLKDADETAALGSRLGPFLQPGDIVALDGDLGTGKTTFARGLIQSELGGDQDVPSPTFTLVQTYDLPAGELWHFDLYRLEEPEEVYELGIEDAFSDAISMIEWPDRMGCLLPRDHLRIELTHKGDGRSVAFRGGEDWGRRLRGLVEE